MQGRRFKDHILFKPFKSPPPLCILDELVTLLSLVGFRTSWSLSQSLEALGDYNTHTLKKIQLDKIMLVTFHSTLPDITTLLFTIVVASNITLQKLANSLQARVSQSYTWKVLSGPSSALCATLTHVAFLSFKVIYLYSRTHCNDNITSLTSSICPHLQQQCVKECIVEQEEDC